MREAMISGAMTKPIDFEALFRAAESGMMILDRAYRVVEMNPYFCEMTGADRDALLGVAILDAYPETNARRRLFEAAYATAFAGEPEVLERQFYSIRDDPEDPSTAQDRWWTVRISPLPGPTGAIDHIVIVAEDQTAEVMLNG